FSLVLAFFFTGGTLSGLKPGVLAAWSGKMFGAGSHGGFPIEYNTEFIITDNDGVTGYCTGLKEGFFDAYPVEPVGQVTNGFVVIEVCLGNPPFGFITADPEHGFHAAFFFGETKFLAATTAAALLWLNGNSLWHVLQCFCCRCLVSAGLGYQFGHSVFQLVQALPRNRRNLKDA